MLFYLFPLEIDALDDELEDDPLLTLDDGLELELDLEIDEEPEPYGWDSDDESIIEVGWCVEIPDDLYWDSKEIKKLINYDWSASKTFKS